MLPFLGSFSPKELPRPLKSLPIGKISPNLVTLVWALLGTNVQEGYFKKSKQGDLKIFKKFDQILEKVAKTVAKPKIAKNIYIKGQFESPKHKHKTTFET
jgi:hypothetical protein